MYLGDVSKTNRANQEDRDFLIGRTNEGLGNGDLHISLSWPNLVLLSHLSCRDHFCFYHRFGLVTFRDCTNWGPLLQKCLKKKLLTWKENQDQCEHWLLENEEYSDEKETKKYSIYYFDKNWLTWSFIVEGDLHNGPTIWLSFEGGGVSMGDLVCVRILFFSKPLMIEFFPN